MNKKGFAHLGLFILIIVISVGVGTFLYVKSVQRHRNAQSTNKENLGSCSEADGLSVCLSASTQQVSSSDNVILKTTIINNTTKEISQTFSCTATDPSILLNEKDLSFGTDCGQAITTVTIKAKATNKYEYNLSGSKLRNGDNSLKSVWGSYPGGTVIVHKNTDSKEEIANQLKICQNLEDNIDSDRIPGYCAGIYIVLKSGVDNYSCPAWKQLMKKVELALPCNSIMDVPGSNAATVYVPRSETENYIAIIKALPEVKNAK